MSLERSMRGETPEGDFLFVDNVRFVSMVAIVFMHCWAVVNFVGEGMPRLMEVAIVPLKFATIGFFVISGFLLGEKLQIVRSRDFLSRRMKRVFVPWAVWYLFFCVVSWYCFHHNRRLGFLGDAAELRLFLQQMSYCLFESVYWFVPNLLLGICVLLMLRRYLYRWGLGAALLAINLFYAANIYGHWMPSRHSEALFGFVFYLWLGSYAAGRRESVMRWLATVPLSWLLLATTVALLGAFAETRLLDGRSVDPLNTLRLSNQVFSMLVVMLLVKVRRPVWPGVLNVRRDTFGIYLTHILVQMAALRVARLCLHEGIWWRNGWCLLVVWLVFSASTYAMSAALTRVLGESRAGWLVGMRGGKAVRSDECASADQQALAAR